jgi:hypothetical protein
MMGRLEHTLPFCVALLVACSAGDTAGEGGGVETGTPDALAAIAAACEADPGVDVRRSLIIPDVGQDPRATCTGPAPASCGPWSFGYLMQNLAQSSDHATVSAFVEEWLATWRTEQTVNGQVLEARPLVDDRILDGWGRTPEGWLRFDDAPFRLLTIVSRFDLRDDETYGVSDTAGQGRFVFGLYGRDAGGVLSPSLPRSFSIIYEFNIPADGCAQKLSWARRWQDLSAIEDDAEHRDALLQITDAFAGPSVASSNLSQLRVNEVELGTLVEGTTQLFLPWQLREFRMQCSEPDGDACDRWSLGLVTTKQSIAKDMMRPENRDAIWEWAAAYQDDLLFGEFVIPETFTDSEGVEHDFLAGYDESYANRGGILPLTPQVDPLTGSPIPYEATCRLANTTCGGCHRIVDASCDNYTSDGALNPNATPDVKTPFLMISHLKPPSGAGYGYAKLSPFLTNIALPARQRDMCEFIERECKVSDISTFITEHSSAH